MKILFLIAVLVVSGLGATYYIDFSTGSDANNGTSKSTPWKYCPGMRGYTGVHAVTSGDTYIGKGGVVWDSGAVQWKISSKTNLIITADTTWYSGGSFTHPKIDCGNKKFNNATPNYSYNATNRYPVWYSGNTHCEFSWWEIYNFTCIDSIGSPSTFSIQSGSNNNRFTHLMVHNFRPGSRLNSDNAIFNCNYDSANVFKWDTGVGIDSGGAFWFGSGGCNNDTIDSCAFWGGLNGGIMPHGSNNGVEIAYNDCSNIWQTLWDGISPIGNTPHWDTIISGSHKPAQGDTLKN